MINNDSLFKNKLVLIKHIEEMDWCFNKIYNCQN